MPDSLQQAKDQHLGEAVTEVHPVGQRHHPLEVGQELGKIMAVERQEDVPGAGECGQALRDDLIGAPVDPERVGCQRRRAPVHGAQEQTAIQASR